MENDHEQERSKAELAAKNRRLAIVLGLIAVGIYLGFIFGYS